MTKELTELIDVLNEQVYHCQIELQTEQEMKENVHEILVWYVKNNKIKK